VKVVYQPANGERREWPFLPDDIEVIDASFIKKQTHLKHGEWKKALLEQDADALHGLLWVLLKGENPLLRWTDVRFRMNEVAFDFDDDEVTAIIARLASMTPEEADDENVASLRAMLEEQGVDVDARISETLADPEFTPEPAPEVVDEDPKA
jgi:hypothetical protein